MKIKMFCIFAKESITKMNGVRGKLASQAGHAYLHAYWDATLMKDYSIDDKESPYHNRVKQALNYRGSGSKAYKITLVVDTVEELKKIQEEYKDICGTSLVTDAGITVFEEPTTTCLGIGPISEENITDTIKNLKLLT